MHLVVGLEIRLGERSQAAGARWFRSARLAGFDIAANGAAMAMRRSKKVRVSGPSHDIGYDQDARHCTNPTLQQQRTGAPWLDEGVLAVEPVGREDMMIQARNGREGLEAFASVKRRIGYEKMDEKQRKIFGMDWAYLYVVPKG